MWIRSAFCIGKPKAGQETAFRELMDKQVVTAMSRFPGVADIKAVWPKRFQDDPPAIWCQVLVEFSDSDAIDRMLASDERAALRPTMRTLAGLFDGVISHIDYEVGGHASAALQLVKES